MQNDVILFDINETVLNLASLEPKFEAVFGSDAAMSLWFSTLLHSSTVCIATKVKTNFAELASVMLDSVATHYGCRLTDGARKELLAGFASLPAHSDIVPSLQQLRSNGFKTVAFSNSSSNLIASQIENAGLTPLFDEIVSVEQTGSFKPNPAVYQFAAQQLDQSEENLRLVATHDWDTHGALTAGLKAAFINRSGAPYHPLYLKPDIQSTSMHGIVAQIIAKSTQS